MRAVLIFGNGLGMALNPRYFALKAGLHHAWNNTAHLLAEQKTLITNAIPGTNRDTPPCSEEQLDKLHGAIGATEYLNAFEGNGQSWVTEYAKKVPSAFRTFIHEVGMYFHDSGLVLPPAFIDPLASFIQETASHVATLNYDNLLYDALIKKQLLNGFNRLIDGYTAEFSELNLRRYRPLHQSYYLHLHGSPLFIKNMKCRGADRNFLSPEENHHIVLTHIKHKPYFIETSRVLSEYWRRLDEALSESNNIFIIGYSGEDIHLNSKLAAKKDKKIVIVEWTGAGDQITRFKFWNNKLERTDYIIYRLDNIFDFTDWHLRRPVVPHPLVQ